MITLPITYSYGGLGNDTLQGADWADLTQYGSATDPIRQIERASIRTFVEKHKHLLTGRVLDFGAGKPGTCRQPQPYRDLVAGEYVPIDEGDGMPHGMFDAVLFTQVIQYLPHASLNIQAFDSLKQGGWLVMTYPTAWSDGDCDLFRFTRTGMAVLLERAGFHVSEHVVRARVMVGSFEFSLGYGVIARKT